MAARGQLPSPVAGGRFFTESWQRIQELAALHGIHLAVAGGLRPGSAPLIWRSLRAAAHRLALPKMFCPVALRAAALGVLPWQGAMNCLIGDCEHPGVSGRSCGSWPTVKGSLSTRRWLIRRVSGVARWGVLDALDQGPHSAHPGWLVLFPPAFGTPVW